MPGEGARLPRQLLERLNQALVDALCPASVGEGSAAGTWRGHRIFGGDGACHHTADTPTLRGRSKSKKPFGFPLLKAVTPFDLASGALIRRVAVPHRRQEGPLLQRLLRHLRRGDVLVLDRAYARRITVLTTLTDPAACPAAEIAQLYARRWEVETNFRHLKRR